MSYGRFRHEQEREIAAARRNGKMTAKERAERWIAVATPEFVGNPIALGKVMVRLDHPSLSAPALRLAMELEK